MPQLSVTAFFCLGLTILAIGYIAVEILGGDNYRFRRSLKRNDNHLFDRIIHYVIWGGIINLAMLFYYNLVGGVPAIINMFNSSGEAAKILNIYGDAQIQLHMIIFSIQLFIGTTLLMIAVYFVGKQIKSLFIKLFIKESGKVETKVIRKK